MLALEESQKDTKCKIRHRGQSFFPKMTEGSTDSVSVQRYNATCPWNPVLSISFVFSIRHDQLSFLFSCSFICYLMEGLPTWKTRPLCLSSQWHHPSGYTWELVSLKLNAAYWEKKSYITAVVWVQSKVLLRHKGLGYHRGSEASAPVMNLKGNFCFRFILWTMETLYSPK